MSVCFNFMIKVSSFNLQINYGCLLKLLIKCILFGFNILIEVSWFDSISGCLIERIKNIKWDNSISLEQSSNLNTLAAKTHTVRVSILY